MFNGLLKREAYPTWGLVLLGAALVMTLSLSLVVPKAGAVTIEELMAQIQALQAQLLVLQGQQSAPVAGACTFTRSLYMGVSSGADVKCLQQYLNSTSYKVASAGAGSPGSETMFYGSLTRAAVAKWQAANSVSPAVGYFGSISRAKYSSMAGGVVTPPGGGVVTPPAAGGLSVALSATTPAARTIVAGAALMPFGKWNFTAGSGDVKVTTLKFKRSGISADAELGSGYLYDEDGNYLAQYSGLGSGVLTFTNSSGLFTVKAGTSKMVEMRVDVSSSASNNHTMAWSLESAADVTSDATSVSGSFPSMSNAMTFVTVSDPNIATLTATVVTTGNSVNAGTTGYLAGSFTLQSANSAVLVNRIVLTQNGSLISSTDVGNIKLVTSGGKQMGATLPSLKGDGTGTFVMSPAYEIPAGQTIQVNVYADILAGVNRTLKFNVLNLRDVQATDKTYNVGVNPSASVTMTQSTVEAGTLTITLDPSSPTGNIAPGQTNVTLAKFKVASYGEQVKVKFVPFKVTFGTTTASGVLGTGVNDEIDNTYLVDDAGNQIGSTITADVTLAATDGIWDGSATGAAATFGTSSANINYLIPANTTRIWSLKADIPSGADAATVTGALRAGTNNYQGQVSLSNGSSTAVDANALTVQSNPFQAKLNSSLGVGNLVKGQAGAKIASYVLSASSAEGINVSTITFTSSTTFPFSNLMTKVNGVQFGDVKGSVTTATDYTFSGSSPAAIVSGGNVTIDVYADVLSTATNIGSSFYIKLKDASAVGAVTATTQTLKDTSANTVSTTANNINSQAFTVNVAGPTITLDNDSSNPAAYQVAMGKKNQVLGIWRINGGTTEDANITEMSVKDRVGTSGNKASFENLQWYKGGVAVGPVVVSATASGTAGSETGYLYTWTFGTPIVVPQNSGISLELRGDVPSFASGGSTSNSTHIFGFNRDDAYVLARGSGSSLTAVVNDSAATALGTASTFNGSNDTTTEVNTITIARTKLTVTSDSTGILTTGHAPSSADVMAVFVFTADPGYDVTISTVTLKLAGATLATINVQLIDSDFGTAWGSSGRSVFGLDPETGMTTGASSSIAFYPAYTLSAGATKRVKVQADTTGSETASDLTFTVTAGSTSGTLAQWYIDNDTTGTTGSRIQNALCWGDGSTACTAAGGAFNLETKVLPVYGPSVRY